MYKMRKIILVAVVLLMIGCSEKKEYENAVLEQMKVDQDIKDYKISPENMAECVVQTSSSKMPGLVAIDPTRKAAYKSYIKMLQLNKSTDPNKALEELRAEFGSPKGLADAHANYAESIVECMAGLVTSTEKPSNE